MFALAALALLADAPVSQPPNAPAALVFDINGRPYRLPMPNGYCTPPRTPAAAVGEHAGANGHIVANLAYMQDCKSANSDDADDQNFIHLKYIKNFNPNAPSRAAYLAFVAKQMGSASYIGEQESEAFAERVERRMENTTGRKIDAQISAVHLGHDDLCVYQARTIAVALKGDEVGMVRMAGCTTWINGRVVTIDVGSWSDRGLGFGAMVRQLRAVAASIAPSE
jgi:hypothetical protein